MTPTQIVIAVASAIGTLVAAAVAAVRLGPDRTRAWVGSAADLVAASDVVVGSLRTQAVSDGLRIDRLQQQVDTLAETVGVLRDQQTAHAAEVDDLRATIRTERLRHGRRVAALTARVTLLEATLLRHDLDIPPHPDPPTP